MRFRRWGLRVVMASLLAIVSSGCGKGSVFITIEGQGANGTLDVPGDVDTLKLIVTGEDDAQLLQSEYALAQLQVTFPLTLGIDPGPYSGQQLRVSAQALRNGMVRATASASVPLRRSEVAELTLRLEIDDGR